MSAATRPRGHHLIDLHTHVLPAIDDGPQTFAESLEMLRLAWAGGTREIVATPHMFFPGFPGNDRDRVTKRFDETIQMIEEWSSEPDFTFLEDMSLYLGAENYLSPEFLQALDHRHLLTINESRYVLLEFFPRSPAATIESALARVLDAGLIPVVAHVERYVELRDRPSQLARLVDRGCLLQVNSSAVLGPLFSRQRRVALTLLKRDLIHIVSSDAHGPRTRRPRLDEATALLSRRFPAARVAAWTHENPRRVIRDESFNS